jgi:protein O-GlcNAc transferase
VQQLDSETYNIAGQMNYVRLKVCDWENYELRTEEFIQSVQKYLNQETAYSPSPLALSSFPVPLALHRQFAESLSQVTVQKMSPIKALCNFAHPTITEVTEKLRIGYISPDFREHAVGKIVKDMFPYHDRTRFEVYAYSTIDYNDAITERIRAGCDRFIDLSKMTSEAAARQINSDGIQILIDLAGRTIGNGLEILALQPAPIQAQFLGYPDTIGAEFIQYAIADSWLITPEIAKSYTEEIIYLPHAFFSSPMEISQRTMTRAEFGIPDDAFVFCCFNSHYKITPELFNSWMRILQQVPTSILWLTGGSETSVGTRQCRVPTNLRREAEKRGIDGNRLFFTEKIPNSEYLARYRLTDLFLDTFIYNAGSTAISALWAGVPVLTRPGNTNASRMGASICAAAELTSLICKSHEEYEQQAIYLATHPRSLGDYRRHLTKNRDRLPLFNVAQFVKNLETAIERLKPLLSS